MVLICQQSYQYMQCLDPFMMIYIYIYTIHSYVRSHRVTEIMYVQYVWLDILLKMPGFQR